MTLAELTIPNGWDEITPAWMYRASVAHGLAIWIATLSGGAWQRPEICLAFAPRTDSTERAPLSPAVRMASGSPPPPSSPAVEHVSCSPTWISPRWNRQWRGCVPGGLTLTP